MLALRSITTGMVLGGGSTSEFFHVGGLDPARLPEYPKAHALPSRRFFAKFDES